SKLAKALPAVRVLSLIAIFVSLVIVTPTNFGLTLALPVLATAILLVTTNSEVKPDLTSKLLSIKPLTSIGTISYSVYLWHWPVVVFGHQLGFFKTEFASFVGVGLVLLLGMIGYYLIERPFMNANWSKLISTSRLRRRKRKKTPAAKKSKLYTSPFVTGVLVVSVAALLAGAFYVNPATGGSANQGWVPPASAQLFAPNAITAANATSSASPTSTEVDTVALEAAMADWKGQIESGVKLTQLPTDLNPNITKSLTLAKLGGWTPCMGQRKDSATISDVCESVPTASAGVKTAILLGDSHMRIFWEAITSSLDLRKWHVVMLGMPSCPVPPLKLKVVSKYNKDCDQHREATFKYVENSKPDLLFISDATNSEVGVAAFKAGYDQVVPRLKAATKQLVLFETSAGTARLMDCLDGGTSLTNCKPKIYKLTPMRQAQREIAKKFGIGYWETSGALCVDLGQGPMCPPVIGHMAVSGDGSHIFPSVSRELAPFLIKTLNDLKIKDLAPVG
ncbi:MAG: acyltransferase, partial [Actinomycetales bacterium]|nr:acyltransferase [Actinomycetales bacterium]